MALHCFINMEQCKKAQVVPCITLNLERRSVGGAWVSHASTHAFWCIPRFTNSCKPGNASKCYAFPGEVQREEISLFLHSVAHFKRGKSPKGLFLCRKVSLPAQKQCCLKSRHLCQGCLRWHCATNCAPVQAKSRNSPYIGKYAAFLPSPFHAAQQVIVLCCVKYL